MNAQPECNCCPSKTCDACLSPCFCRPHVSFRNRAERPLKYEANCGAKNCGIFGSHDITPLPSYHGYQKLIKTQNENKNSLGAPIGLVTSTVNFKTEGKTVDIMQARYATYLKAFARLHLNDEKEWNSQLLDDIMTEGLDLYTNSQNSSSAVETVATDNYMSHEQHVVREFVLSGFTFQIELMPKFQLVAADSAELGANGDGIVLTLEDVMPALRSFLRQHKYALLKVSTFYTMIWRSRDAYFVFDVCGRRLTDFQTVKGNGVAMLMCFKSLENIRHLLNNLSGLPAAEPLVIRELKLVKVVTPQGNIMQLDYSLRNHQYEIVNDDYAYLRSDLHLTLNKRDLLRSRSGLPVAVTAIIVSKIDHPATWDRKMVDKIICFGVNFWQSRCMKCESTEPIDVNEFPTTFALGQFHINIEIKGHLYGGRWHCVPVFKESELANALNEAFNDKHHKLVLQINYQMYAIWKKQEFIYLLDPYRHRIMGGKNESKMYEEMEKRASVRMFRDFQVFMNVLNHILIDSNRTSCFSLHFIKVKNIQILSKEKPGQVRQIKEPQRDDYGEVLSINEHICFEEAEDLCKAALGEISDYEDDDLKSDVVEMELRTSSSEEDLLEEEEAGAGEVGEMEDIESSSSGEEGRGHKMKAEGNRERGKRNKSIKSKEAKKGGHHKNKKGKGANANERGTTESDIQINDKGKKSKKSQKTDHEMKSKKRDPNEQRDDESGLRPKTKRGKYLKENDDTDTGKSIEGSEKSASSKNYNIEEVQENHIVKQKPGNEESSKSKNISKEKALLKDKEESKDREESRETDANKNKKLSKDRDLNKRKDHQPSKDKAFNKKKDPSTGEHISKDEPLNVDENTNKADEFNQDKVLPKDKIISKDKLLSRDKDISKDSDLSKTLVEQKYGNSKDKINKDLNKLVNSEGKSDLAKSKTSVNDTNKENEIFKSSHKFIDDKEREEKDKSVDRFKERTEKVRGQSRDDRGKKYKDGTEADDENEEGLERRFDFCSTPNPNSYPGYFKHPADMAVLGSESGSYESICKLFQAGFKVADRLLLMTPWGNFVIFRCIGQSDTQHKHYYLFDGCTCNFERFRHFDLSVGTAGLICFEHLHNIIGYIRQLRKSRNKKRAHRNSSADDICREYCNKSVILRV